MHIQALSACKRLRALVRLRRPITHFVQQRPTVFPQSIRCKERAKDSSECRKRLLSKSRVYRRAHVLFTEEHFDAYKECMKTWVSSLRALAMVEFSFLPRWMRIRLAIPPTAA